MSGSEIVLSGIEALKQRMRRDMPPEFEFEIEDHHFRDVGSCERACRIQNTMEGLKDEARKAGYDVAIRYFGPNNSWKYHFRSLAKQQAVAMALPKKPDAIDV